MRCGLWRVGGGWALAGVFVLAASSGARAQDAGDAASSNLASESAGYPVVYIDRPLTLPGSMAEVAAGAGYWWVEDEENVAATRVAGSVGLTDWWEAAVTTRFDLAPDRGWGQVVGVGTWLRALDTARLDLAPGLSAPLVFDGDRDTEPVPVVEIDALTRIRVLRRMALHVGDDLVPVGLGDDASVSVDLNAAVVSQMNDRFAVRVSMQLFHIRLHGDVRESDGPAGPLSFTFLFSPATWLDLWLGYQVSSTANGAIAGIAARIP